MKLFTDGKLLEDKPSIEGRIVLDTPGKVVWNLVCIGGGSASFDIDIASGGVDFTLDGVYLCSADDRLDIRVNLTHSSGGSASRQLLRGVVGGSSRVNFDGRITVCHGAAKTEAFQTNNNIQLSEGASVTTSPQLEIYADDVQCSHGATAGMLDGDELFYMRSRGLTFKQARRLQISSFLTPAMGGLPEAVREEILDSIPED